MKIAKDILLKEYVENKKSMKQIAEEYSLAVGTIYNYIKKYGIKSRIKMTEETKKKISQSNKGKKYALGCKWSKEAKEKLSQAKKIKGIGHRKKRTDGYIYIYFPSHPKSTKDGYIMEHDLIMESCIGRWLKEDEVVHHINHIKDDNRIENLKLMTFKEHAKLHMIERHRKGVMTYQ